ncbi:hypothetical protein ACN42_g1292 [Penicillium freii]|uniref:Uncharacterized protein n=1 Tax=Penicillium freii TaxID=48697 RepID=A0A117NRL2_PENFR|nr:hypothetical protein ACN42_g1292 [Penicillium freii]
MTTLEVSVIMKELNKLKTLQVAGHIPVDYLIFRPDGLVVRFIQLTIIPISPLTHHRYDSPFGFTSQIRRGRVFESRFGPSSFCLFAFFHCTVIQ